MFKAEQQLLAAVALVCFTVTATAAPYPNDTPRVSSVLVDGAGNGQVDEQEDAPAAPEADEPVGTEYTVSQPYGSCTTSCVSNSCCGGISGKPWALPQPCMLQNLGIKIGGWLQQGITFNGQNPRRFNGPVATNDFDSEWQMNQWWFYMDRPVKRGGGLSIGGHLDIMYGSDHRFGINYGLEDNINGEGQYYGIVMPQFYGEVAYGNLSVKLGHQAAILDYEVIPAPLNPFYSHSYSYGYTVPQLVTGVLADYMLTDQFSVQAGFHRGWFMFEDINSSLDFMGGFKWNSCDKKTSVAWAMSNGPQDPAGDHNRFVYSLVVKQQLTENLQCVLVHNLGNEDNGALNGDDAEWYGLNKYFLYKINECWSANMRYEWMRDDDGARIAGPGNIPNVRAWNGLGYPGNFYEVTAGLNWRPHPNLLARPELRWDWYDGLAGPRGLPFDDGTSDDQFTAACDLVFTY